MTIKWTALRMRGFTLIELLVVVAIVAVLLAILIAGLRLAQEMGRDTICKANLNQLFLGTFLYSEDSDHMLLYFGRMRGRPPNHECFYRLRHTASMPMASNAIVAGSGITLSVPFV